MWSAMIGVGGLVLGAAVGYLARAAEFRRGERLRLYGEFVEAVQRFALTVTARTIDGTATQMSPDHWEQLISILSALRGTATRVGLVGGPDVRKAAIALETWVEAEMMGADASELTRAARSDLFGRTVIDWRSRISASSGCRARWPASSVVRHAYTSSPVLLRP